jgi:hypothetical protein
LLPLPLQRRELGFKAGLPSAQQLLDLIIQTALALELRPPPDGPATCHISKEKQVIHGLLNAYRASVSSNSPKNPLITDENTQEDIIREAFSQAYRLYENIDKETAKSLLEWPWYLSRLMMPEHYHATVLMCIGCELGHLRGREQMILDQLQHARTPAQDREQQCLDHTSV